MLVALPGLSKYARYRAPIWRNYQPAKLWTGQQNAPSRRRRKKAALLDLRAAALDQNDQHGHSQHTGNNLNDEGTIHIQSSFPQ
jgi:hypothetical protein